MCTFVGRWSWYTCVLVRLDAGKVSGRRRIIYRSPTGRLLVLGPFDCSTSTRGGQLSCSDHGRVRVSARERERAERTRGMKSEQQTGCHYMELCLCLTTTSLSRSRFVGFTEITFSLCTSPVGIPKCPTFRDTRRKANLFSPMTPLLPLDSHTISLSLSLAVPDVMQETIAPSVSICFPWSENTLQENSSVIYVCLDFPVSTSQHSKRVFRITGLASMFYFP